MPIRFRCVYCNQLLGISRRKAGTIVRCTSCEGQLIVPDPNDPATEAGHPGEVAPPDGAPQMDQPGAPGSAFEGAEFDAFLEPFNSASSAPAVARAPAPSAASPGGVGADPTPALTLGRVGLTIAIALVVLGLGLAFAGGLVVGLAMR
jgi:hypothetical protein